MTRSLHAKLTRNVLSGLAIAVALGGFQVACASSLSKGSTGIPYSSNGKTIDFGSGPKTANTTPNTNVGGHASIDGTGFYHGTNAQMYPPSNPAAQMELGANGDVFFPGTKYPYQAGYNVPSSSVAEAALGLLGGWPGALIGVTLAAYPHIKNWLDDAGVAPNPNATSSNDAFLASNDGSCKSDCYFWQVASVGLDGIDYPSVAAACTAGANTKGQAYDFAEPFTATLWMCHAGDYRILVSRVGSRPPDPLFPKSMDDIAPYLMRTLMNPGIVNEVIQGGGTINLPQPNITGPSSIQGEPTTSTSTGTQTVNGQQVPTRTETKTQTTYNFTTNNNQVTNTTNTTTTTTVTTNQSTGVVIGSTTTETETKPEEKDERSECEKNPKQLNCSDLDVPDGEIPKAKFNVTYSIEDSWGGGSCPADVYTNVGGQSLKAYDWQQTCGYVSTYVRPILLLLCAFGALWIVIPGKADS